MSSARRNVGQRPRGAIVIGGADRFGQLVVKTGKDFVVRHPAISVSWVLGLLISILATGFTPTFESQGNYQMKMSELDVDSLSLAEEDVLRWNSAYQRTKGWFWSCDSVCQVNKEGLRESQARLDSLMKEYSKGVANAKSELGLFSVNGVDEARQLFWGKVAGGKQFARRATMYDAVFVGLGSMGRDEGIMSFIIRIAVRLIVNLTIGLFFAVIGFMFHIWRVITSYEPDPISSLAFFAAASVAAISLFATWLLGLASAAAGGVYVLAKAAEASQLEGGNAGQGGVGGVGGQHRGGYDRVHGQEQYMNQQYQQQQQQRPGHRGQATQQAGGRQYWDHLD